MLYFITRLRETTKSCINTKGKGVYLVLKKTWDYRKLKGRIVEKFNTLGLFAEAIGRSPQQVSSKLNEGTAFTTDTITEWANTLDIEMSDYGSYFFTPKV